MRSQTAPLGQLGLNAIESPRGARRYGENHIASQRHGAVVDMIEPRIVDPLFITVDPQITGAVGAHDGVAAVPTAFVSVDRHHAVGVGVAHELAQRGRIIEGEIAVSVGDEELWEQSIGCLPYGTGGAHQVGAFIGVFDAEAKALAASHGFPNLVAEVRNAEKDAVTCLREPLEQPRSKRATRHRKEELGDGERPRTHCGVAVHPPR